MTHVKWIKLAIMILLLGIIITGYGGLCAKTNEATIAGNSAPLPSAVSSLMVTVISPTQVSLTWQDNSNNEDGFKIERAPTGQAGTFTQIAIAPANAISYSDNSVIEQITYYYRIKAYNTNGDSMYSNEASASIPFGVPSLLTGTVISDTQISITWVDNSNVETGFQIERKTGNNGTYAQITITSANTTSYSDSAGLTSGNTYYYRNRAYNTDSDSAYSNEISVTIPNWRLQTTAGGPPSARYGHSMVWTGLRVILFGGLDGSSYKNDLWWYDPTANTWTEKTPTSGPPTARAHHSMVWDGSKVILFGGTDGFNYYNFKNDLWWYDPTANTWTEKTPTGGPPSARLAHSMVWDGSKVILFGGFDISYPCYKNDLWWYDPTANTWQEKTPTGDSPPARTGHSMVWNGAKVIMFGGSAVYAKNDLWWYDPTANTWTEKTPTGGPPSARCDHSMVWDDTKVILFGGNPYTNDLWWYEPTANIWQEKTLAGDPPSARGNHSMIWDGSRVILFGGDNASSFKNDLWWYSP